MLRHVLLPLVAVFLLLAAPLRAQETEADTLFDAMGLPAIIAVMGEEGRVYGDTIARDLFPGGPSPRWAAIVAEIYDVTRIEAEMRSAFTATLAEKDLTEMLAFYQSELGRQVVSLEIAARQAMLDPVLEQAAKDRAAVALADETPRIAQITDFITANDLIESNVVGGLNANYAFLSGLLSGGGNLPGMSGDDLLAQVWAQEPDIRVTTTEWLYAFLMLSYQPLSDDELAALTDFTRTDAGRDLTAALFAAFDQTFERVSRDMGSAASGFIGAQEL
jgi:hypothetical protein